jgi:MFS family permease
MKRLLTWFVLIFFSSPLMSAPVHSTAIIAPIEKPIPNEALLKKIASLKIKDLQKLTGRKFSLKKKIAFLVLKNKLKHKSSDDKSPGQTALVFGIAALALLIIGLFVPYVILGSIVSSILAIVVGTSAYKKDHSDRKAQAGKILGWISLGLAAILIILAAIIVAFILNGF